MIDLLDGLRAAAKFPDRDEDSFVERESDSFVDTSSRDRQDDNWRDAFRGGRTGEARNRDETAGAADVAGRDPGHGDDPAGGPASRDPRGVDAQRRDERRRDEIRRRFEDRSAKIYLAGHTGLVGSAIHRKLQREGYENVITRRSRELDLRDQDAVNAFFAGERPEFVILAAAKVGGILANDTYPAEFLYDNLMIAANVIHASHRVGVRKLLNLGSSCIYPKHAPQPLKEEYLLTGQLESTNRAYAIAKIAAIELCDAYRRQHGDDFISGMPTNLYGPHDNFDLETSHVMAALIRKFHDAAERGDPAVTVWGTGKPKREFLYVEDLADACMFLMRHVSEPGPINIGTGKDISIEDLARLIKDVTGYEGDLTFDTSKPDGTPRKLMDVTRLERLGWQAHTGLREGIEKTLAWYRENVAVA